MWNSYGDSLGPILNSINKAPYNITYYISTAPEPAIYITQLKGRKHFKVYRGWIKADNEIKTHGKLRTLSQAKNFVITLKRLEEAT